MKMVDIIITVNVLSFKIILAMLCFVLFSTLNNVNTYLIQQNISKHKIYYLYFKDEETFPSS